MRIGKFVENNDISIDSIRHYMDMGLIVPDKKGGQYYFDERCQKDLEDILNLKSLGFALKEIKYIFAYKRIAKFTHYQQHEHYKEFFINKQNDVLKEIQELNNIKDRLEEKIKELNEKDQKENLAIGIDFKYLNLFRCLKCNGELVLCDGSIKNNQIITGKLKCNCGEEYFIEDGILKAGEASNHWGFDINYISEYVTDTDSDYLDKIYRGLEWSHNKIDFEECKGKVILELGSGMGVFLRHVYDSLPEDCLYIAVDHDMGRHKFLKKVLEKADCKRNVILICSDFLKIPLKEKSADIIVDFSGSSNYSFKHEEFLLRKIDKYTKDKGQLIGCYILFKNFSENTLIKEKCRKNFTMENIKKEIDELKYTIVDENISSYLEKGGKYESYFVEGEKVYCYIVHGER